MIRIHKPSEPPAVLREHGPRLLAEVCRLVELGEVASLRFDSMIYGAAEVKEHLKAIQHDKCCFCESKISHVAFGDVEHFRPKKAVRQADEQPERKPGYYWLAYEWSNLYLACEECNRRHKRNFFPLENDDLRALSHVHAGRLDEERPLFIDPGREDPSEHLEFRRAYVGAVSGSPRGHATIEALSLNRPPLRDRRLERRELLLTILGSVRIWLATGCPPALRSDVERAASFLLHALHDESEFAAMGRALAREAMPWCTDAPPSRASDLLHQLELAAEQGRTLVIPPR
jgi:uncharacterized protein (TIGR02646 family)